MVMIYLHFKDDDSKKSAKKMKNFHNHQNLNNIIFFLKILNFCLTEINIYLIDKQIIFWRNMFFRKKS